jgi:hypothetical protein
MSEPSNGELKTLIIAGFKAVNDRLERLEEEDEAG